MTVTVPDTLNGAFLLSIIDFFLSFLVISFIGLVLAAFPLLNRLRLGADEKIQVQLPPVHLGEPVDMTADDHVAAIAAAVAAVMGAHRIVHIEPAHHGGGWLAEGRSAQHGSHNVGHRSAQAVPQPHASTGK